MIMINYCAKYVKKSKTVDGAETFDAILSVLDVISNLLRITSSQHSPKKKQKKLTQYTMNLS